MLKHMTLRNFLFVVGAVGSVSEAINLATKADAQVTPAHLIAVGCVALTMFALRWPTDVTAKQAREIEARARRESITPPGGEP